MRGGDLYAADHQSFTTLSNIYHGRGTLLLEKVAQSRVYAQSSSFAGMMPLTRPL
jgi:hypothetical protein